MNDLAEQRANVLQHLESGRLSETEACERLELGPRQVRRLRKRLMNGGIAALIHGNQGRTPFRNGNPAWPHRGNRIWPHPWALD